MDLLVIRHGQSQADLEDRHEGRADFPLTERGRLQAIRAAQFIYKNYPLRKLIASPLLRAKETADIIGKHLDIPVHEDERLMEMNNGKLAGMLRSEALEKFPYPEGGRKSFQHIHGGESEIEFRSRVEHFFQEFTHQETLPWVGIVAHGGSINMLFRCFMDLPVKTNIYLSTGDTGIHYWHVTPKHRQIIFNNYREHIADLDS